MKPRLKVQLRPLCGHRYAIFELWDAGKKGDHVLPKISLQMPTEIAEYLKQLVEKDQAAERP